MRWIGDDGGDVSVTLKLVGGLSEMSLVETFLEPGLYVTL